MKLQRRGFFGAIAAAPMFSNIRRKPKPSPELLQPCLVCSKTGHKMQHGYLRPKMGEKVYTGPALLAVWCENRPINWDWYVWDSQIGGFGSEDSEDDE